MENKTSKIASMAFLILIVSTVEMPGFLKYPMLAIATVSFIITVVQLYHESKANQLSSKEKK